MKISPKPKAAIRYLVMAMDQWCGEIKVLVCVHATTAHLAVLKAVNVLQKDDHLDSEGITVSKMGNPKKRGVWTYIMPHNQQWADGYEEHWMVQAIPCSDDANLSALPAFLTEKFSEIHENEDED